MEIWIGIDGGGTKTNFLSIDGTGRQLAAHRAPGTDVHAMGMEAVCRIVREGVETVCAGLRKDDVRGICFGMPSYGENGPDDTDYAARLQNCLAPLPLRIVNDVEAGLAGALALRPGVVIVCGTGAMALGRDAHGRVIRAGGWADYFSDEGSGLWLGKKALELFSKESDGRLPRGPLYSLIRRELCLRTDVELNNLVRSRYERSRQQTASLQRILLEAARSGDSAAKAAYTQAAGELALAAEAVIARADFSGAPSVSYIGGVWHSGELLLKPLRERLAGRAEVLPPLFSAEYGAALLACEDVSPERLADMRRCDNGKQGGKSDVR